MLEVVGVSFKENGQIYYFLPNNYNLEENMNVIVETEHGIQYASVVKKSLKIEEKNLKSPLKSIIRIADKEDYKKHQKNVRDSIQIQLSEMLKDAENIEDVREILEENLPGVEYTVKNVLEKNAYNNKFELNYGYNYFPEKIYKGIVYEEGFYESIVIKLGESKGDNWWCVLFPPLCLMSEEEENIEEVEYKSFIKEIIDRYF